MAEQTLMLQLEKQYCPPIDTATFLAILLDYDINEAAELDAARQVLDQLAQYVNVEDGSGFDPSGTSGGKLLSVESEYGDRSGTRSEGSNVGSIGRTTDTTEVSERLSALDLEGIESWSKEAAVDGVVNPLDSNRNLELESLDSAAKEAILLETFPGLKPFDISWALRKSKGNASLAIEELLNQVFLEENGERRRGVDGFSESDVQPPRRKNKGKKKRHNLKDTVADANSLESSPELGSTIWESARQDVEFLSSRSNIPMQQISSVYHKNGASMSATINAIIDAHIAVGMENNDPNIDFEAQELIHQFPTITLPRLLALVQLTYPSKTSAHELAKALIKAPTRSGTSTPIEIKFQLPPPELVGSSAPSKLKAKSRKVALSEDFISSQSPATSSSSSDYASLRNGAFNQASAAYRRGKSDYLMGGAAAYYASLGRDFDAKTKAATSAEANALVASQSTDAQLDLHGANVKDGVRIAREYVTNWWVRDGGRSESHTGFKIVTGKGMHSEGGRGRLGPAVGAMLIREGWKVEVGSGAMLVTGVVRKR